MLCHCVTPANRARYPAQLDAMFRQRHQVFVEKLGWKELRKADGRDIDEYDTPDTVYFLVLNDAGEVVASTRMNPTWSRHQLEPGGSLRQRFADHEPERGPHVWEASRLIGGFREKYGRDFARETLGVLVAATQEFCARRGVSRGLSILELSATMMLQAIGIETEPLGLPVTYETEFGPADAISVSWGAGARPLARVRERFGLVGPIFFEAGPVLSEVDSGIPCPGLMENVAEISSEAGRRAVWEAARQVLLQEMAGRAAPAPSRRRARSH